MSRWFRWYEGSCEDGKFRMIARVSNVTVATVVGIWAILLEDASSDDHRGLAIRGLDYYSAILEVPHADVLSIVQIMIDIGMVSSCPPKGFTITKWKHRQFETDASDGTNALRQRRYRQKKTALRVTDRNATVTDRNGGVTDRVTQEKILEEENSNEINVHVTPLRNGSVTAAKRPETETETDIPSLRSGSAPDGAKAKRPAKERNRRSQLPELWQPDEQDVTYAHSRGHMGEKLFAMSSAFSNFHRSRGSVMADWHAAWRTWCDNEIKFHGGKNGRRKTVHEANDELLAQVLALDEPAPSGICGGESENAVRLLPSR